MSMVHLKVTEKRTSPVKSRILPSPILLKEMTATKNPCSLDDFLVVELPVNRKITSLWRPSQQLSGEIRMLPYISTSRNTIVLKRRESWSDVPWSQSRWWASCIFNVSRSECNLSLSKRDFFVLLYYNTQSYWIREHFVSLSYFSISIKVTFFLPSYLPWHPFCIENQTSESN